MTVSNFHKSVSKAHVQTRAQVLSSLKQGNISSVDDQICERMSPDPNEKISKKPLKII